MNYRQEIDALPPKPNPNAMPWAEYKASLLIWYQEAHLLAARIHAEPHGDGCMQSLWAWEGPEEGGRFVRIGCTCGKDAAMREVLGQ